MSLNARAYKTRWQILLKVTLLILLIVAANLLASWIADALNFQIRPSNEELVHRTIMIVAVIYAALIAIPFVPGVEVGLALIAMLGPAIVLLVYLCTLAGLATSFVIGRVISLKVLIKLLDDVHFDRASRLFRTIEPMNMDDRLAFLVAEAPHRIVPFLLRHRYLALAIVLNLPGNFLLGGGGGISMLAGASRLFSTPGFLATVAVAVSPVPLAIMIFGKEILSS